MGILVIALSINPRPLSALKLKLSGLIMESRVYPAGDNQNAIVIISKDQMPLWHSDNYENLPMQYTVIFKVVKIENFVGKFLIFFIFLLKT